MNNICGDYQGRSYQSNKIRVSLFHRDLFFILIFGNVIYFLFYTWKMESFELSFSKIASRQNEFLCISKVYLKSIKKNKEN